MKAIVQVRYGSPDGLELREIDPPAVADDRVLVRVRAASVNAADWHLLRRLPRLVARLLGMHRSRVPGADLAGQAAAVGRNVTRFAPGDEVFGTGLGSFAEYATAEEDRLAAKPRRLSFAEAAAIPVAGCTALQGMRDRAQVEAGQKVLVYGAGGGVGTFAVQVAKALGAHLTAVSSPQNVELLRTLGADRVLDYTRDDFTASAERYDVLFDLGANRSLADCTRVLAANGRHVLAGAPAGFGALVSRLLAPRPRSRRDIQRLTFMARVRHEDLDALRALVEDGRLSPVIDRQYALSEAPEALRYLGTRQVRGKLVLRIA